jgi:hypothetical protein
VESLITLGGAIGSAADWGGLAGIFGAGIAFALSFWAEPFTPAVVTAIGIVSAEAGALGGLVYYMGVCDVTG